MTEPSAEAKHTVNEWRVRGSLATIAQMLDAFAAHAVAAERSRIATRVSERVIVRLSVGSDPLDAVNEVIQDLAHDIATNWEDYDDDE